jgi:hypothetical protein
MSMLLIYGESCHMPWASYIDCCEKALESTLLAQQEWIVHLPV